MIKPIDELKFLLDEYLIEIKKCEENLKELEKEYDRLIETIEQFRLAIKILEESI